MAEEPQEGRAPVDVACPNCNEVVPGLFYNMDHGVRHCGCFYEKNATVVRYHVSTSIRSYDAHLKRVEREQ